MSGSHCPNFKIIGEEFGLLQLQKAMKISKKWKKMADIERLTVAARSDQILLIPLNAMIDFFVEHNQQQNCAKNQVNRLQGEDTGQS